MVNRTLATLVTTVLLACQCAALPAHAETPMGYRLLSQQEAAGLPRNQGRLGMDVDRAQQITEDGMTFDILGVRQVGRGSPGAQAGFKVGDQIIAVDGRVFPSIATFAAYVGSISPGRHINVDYIPSGEGPQQAQRIAVAVGTAGQAAQATASNGPASATGMSTGSKVAIGVGAAALLGCYELGCFSHRSTTAAPNAGRQQAQQPDGSQQR